MYKNLIIQLKVANFLKDIKYKTHMEKQIIQNPVAVQSLSRVDFSPPGSSVHGFSQARIQEWVAISFSRESSLSRNQTCVFFIGSRLSTNESPEKLQFTNLHLFTIVSVINDIPKKNTSYRFTGEVYQIFKGRQQFLKNCKKIEAKQIILTHFLSAALP